MDTSCIGQNSLQTMQLDSKGINGVTIQVGRACLDSDSYSHYRVRAEGGDTVQPLLDVPIPPRDVQPAAAAAVPRNDAV
jgi:hypothetical protein